MATRSLGRRGRGAMTGSDAMTQGRRDDPGSAAMTRGALR